MMEEMPLRCNNSGKGAIQLTTEEVIDERTDDIVPGVITLLGHSLGRVRTLTLQIQHPPCSFLFIFVASRTVSC